MNNYCLMKIDIEDICYFMELKMEYDKNYKPCAYIIKKIENKKNYLS